jgi:SAM-dependent methyltransferase
MLNVGSQNEFTRNAWVKQSLANLPPGSRILDAGAGEQKYRPFCQHLKYVSQDFARYDGQGDGVGLQTGNWQQHGLDIVSDITAVPEPDASFDAVLCTEVLEHVPEPLKAFQEFSRLLKPGGYLILTAPFCSLTHYAPYHFYSGFNSYFYKNFLPKHGFAILELTKNGNYFDYLAQEVRRLKTMAPRYAGAHLNIFELMMLQFSLLVLERLCRKDHDSGELLCFGYHILAKKEGV